MATRTNFLAVQVISNGNRTEWTPIRPYSQLIINMTLSKDLAERTKTLVKGVNLFEKMLTWLFLLDSISLSLFSYFNTNVKYF